MMSEQNKFENEQNGQLDQQNIQRGEQQEQKEKKRKWLWPLILLLLLLVAITFFLIGYMLSRQAGIQWGGKVIDDIPITVPGDATELLSVSGLVRYRNGGPVTDTAVEFHSEPRKTVTNDKGYFFFHAVDNGVHHIYVMSDHGAVLATCEVDIFKNSELETIKVTRVGNVYTIEIPVTVIMIEVEIILDEYEGSVKNPTLSIEAVRATTGDGDIISEDRRWRPEDGGSAMTEIGNKVFDDGTILLDNRWVLLNDGTLIRNSATELTLRGGVEMDIDEIIMTENGSIVIPDTAIITPNGHIITYGNDVIEAGGGVTFSDGTSPADDQTVVTLPDGETVFDRDNDTITLPDGTVIDRENGEIILPDGTTIDMETGVITPPEDTTPPDSDGSVRVISENKDWTQDTLVDLFKNIKKLYPGVKGAYTFTVSNSRREPIVFTMTVTDTHDDPIPFVLKLKDRNGNDVDATNVILAPRTSMEYTLYWEWPYESGDDKYDTELGLNKNLKHIITITIEASALT